MKTGCTVFAFVLFLAVACCHVMGQPLNPDEAALVVLEGACRGFNEKKYDYAVERFREFLKLYAGHREASRAHYGLGLSLLVGSRPDPEAALQSLSQAAANAAFADRAFALYYAGVARRMLGDQAAERTAAKPAEAAGHLAVASQHYTEALRCFTEAAAAFRLRVGTAATAQPVDHQEWLIRSQCDLCDMHLRLRQYKEARALAESLLDDPAIVGSRFADYASYYLGCACFALRDLIEAGRALSRLAPFQQPFGLAARYLLGRVHHLQNDRAEAAAQYRAVLR